MAIRNAILSHRGSIHTSHCAVTWCAKLLKLEEMASADPQTVVKAYNAKASSGGQLSGQKRISVLALMKAPREAVKTVVNTVSVLGSTMSPWTDELRATQSMFPGFIPRKYGEVWNKRLATTAECSSGNHTKP